MTRHVLIGIVVLVLGIIAGLFYFRDRGNSLVPQPSGGEQVTGGTPTPESLGNLRDGSTGFGSLPGVETTAGAGAGTGAQQSATQGAGTRPSPGQQAGGLVGGSVGEQKGGGAEVVGGQMVRYTNAGFSPATLTVKSGTTVTFMNESTSPMWVASGTHPTHQLLPGFDQLRAVDAGGTYAYTFVRVGTWQYHNDAKVSDVATVSVSN